MRQFLNILILLLVSNVVFAQAQRTFVKSFNLKGDNFVTLHLDGLVVVKEWDETFVRVLTNVTYDNANDTALRFFAQKGRYRLSMTASSGATISSAIHTNQIKYQGQELYEIITYTVFIPKNVQAIVREKEESETKSSADLK